MRKVRMRIGYEFGINLLHSDLIVICLLYRLLQAYINPSRDVMS